MGSFFVCVMTRQSVHEPFPDGGQGAKVLA